MLSIENFISNQSDQTLFIILLLLVWSIFWKGLALWRAAGNRDIVWFVLLFVINTFGILDILYLRIFSKRKQNTAI